MPADHGVGLNEDQDLLPSRPGSRQEDLEGPIGRTDSGFASFQGESGELLTQGEFDDRLFSSASKEGRNTTKGDPREFEQVPHSEAILHGFDAQFETDPSAGFELSSVVDRLSTGREKLNDFEVDRF